MTKHVKIPVTLWQGQYGEQIRQLELHTRYLALYLMTSPAINMVGVYRLPFEQIAKDTGLSVHVIGKAMAELERAGICRYEEKYQCVWVCDFLEWQLMPDEYDPGLVQQAAKELKQAPFG